MRVSATVAQAQGFVGRPLRSARMVECRAPGARRRTPAAVRFRPPMSRSDSPPSSHDRQPPLPAEAHGLLAEVQQQVAGLLHDVRNPTSAVHLALRAVGRHLQGDEKAALDELAARLSRLQERAAALADLVRRAGEPSP